jgi:predicted DNA-binding transcriptional regulator AlpA
METNCQLASEAMHHLLDINGVADLIGITRQGAYKLIERDETFPPPEVTVTAGRIWSTEAVEGWAKEPGHRRSVRFVDVGDQLHRYRCIVAGVNECVAVPRTAVLHEQLLEWAREQRYPESGTTRFDEATVLVPLRQWDTRVDMTGRIK